MASLSGRGGGGGWRERGGQKSVRELQTAIWLGTHKEQDRRGRMGQYES